jgi:ABC-type lipoprotein release transport system permease subunit
MGLILKVSLRNLIRQKRRNILLGISIAFGVCILIIANSFSHGLSDILLNKIIGRAFGHIIVMMNEKGKHTMPVIRDKDRIEQAIQNTIEGIEYAYEGVQTFTRALGNGKSEFIVLVGVEADEEFYAEMPVLEGDLHDLTDAAIENPISLYKSMAESLNVNLHDTIKVKFQTIYGQSQSGRFTVVAILKSGNPFMDIASFTHLNTLKPLMGYEPYETAAFSISMKELKNPKVVITEAEKLHTALTPNVAGYKGSLQANTSTQPIEVLSVLPEETAHQVLYNQLQIVAGDLEQIFTDERAVVVSQTVADGLGVDIGDEVSLAYESRFQGPAVSQTYQVGAIFEPDADVTAAMVFVHADAMYATFFPVLPKDPVRLQEDHPLFSSLIKEWTLLKRSPDSKSFQKKLKDLRNTDWQGATLDVTTMYEAASQVLQLESVLKIVTLIAVLILFFIILIGVVNTLRMTIRERTREIGTIRAIGMQRTDVGKTFMAEVLLLTLFAAIAGIILAFIVMKLVGFITIQDEGFFSIFLVEKHLHFVPTWINVVQNLALILVITFITAFFPSRRAAKMSVASALRHYE